MMIMTIEYAKSHADDLKHVGFRSGSLESLRAS
jgi:hypothetical protein